ncbi:MAG: hypothetical protein IPI06_04125 [Gammaproteobacteria bacterium]|nr:hypothetical protein [Gammaproteobacteria bacterium]
MLATGGDAGGAGAGAGAETVRLNAASEALALPSLTEITIPLVVPTSPEAGVPLSTPVEVENAAHVGLFVIENVSASPFASDAVGAKRYAVPTVAALDGDPPMVGAVLVGAGAGAGADAAAETVRLNAASEALALPSLTEITIPLVVPTSPEAGVPLSTPVEVENAAHAGLFVIEKLSASPSASDAAGPKRYAVPTVVVVAGEPLMVGAVLVDVGAAAFADCASGVEPESPPPHALSAAAISVVEATRRRPLIVICTLPHSPGGLAGHAHHARRHPGNSKRARAYRPALLRQDASASARCDKCVISHGV